MKSSRSLNLALCLGLSAFALIFASAAHAEESTYIAPRKQANPRIHDANRPTTVGAAPGATTTVAPGVNGSTSNETPQSPANGLLVDAGLGAGFGMHAPGAVWGLGGEYRFTFDGLPDRMALKGLADVNFGYGSDLTQFLEIGVGFNWYVGDMVGTETKLAYISADIAAGDATNAVSGHSATSAVVGVGGSYTFLHTPQVDFNALIHYAILLNQLDSSTPSLLTFRVGMAF